MKKSAKIWIIIPAYNEALVIAKVIDKVKRSGFKNIIVVDDGSEDDTAKVIKKKRVTILRHLINRGKGAATQTGFDAAKKLNAEIVVTIDGDDQHNPKEIKRLVKPLLSKKYDVVLGSRLLKQNNIPLSRRIINLAGNLFTYFLYGIFVSDSQSGFRAYNKKALKLINTTFDRYEFESEILNEINTHHLRYCEVPISVSYTKYSMNKWKNVKGVPAQSFLNGFKMVFKMIIKSLSS